MAGTYTTVTFNIPDSVEAGKDFNATVNGHQDYAYYGWPPNLAIGLYYEDGPVSEVTMVVDSTSFKISKESGISFHTTETVAQCTNLNRTATIKGLTEGTYTFSAVSGYFQDNLLYVDDKITKTVTVKSTTPPPSGKYALTIDTKSWWLFTESDFLKEVGTTDPAPGTHYYDPNTVARVEAKTTVFGTLFDRWIIDGEKESKDNPITLTMDKDHTLTAYFIPAQAIAGIGAFSIAIIYLMVGGRREYPYPYAPPYTPPVYIISGEKAKSE
jgi:hypothetical protein